MAETWVPGLDLAEAFYAQVLAPLVEVPHSACLLGEGSEVIGFDTPRSRDHEWGPRAQLFVGAEYVGAVRERIARGLPSTFEGYQTAWFSLSKGAVSDHVEVVTIEDWMNQSLGFDPRAGMDAASWLGSPQQQLLQVTAGRVFHDDTGELTRVRDLLAWYPDDVWAWMMLSAWHLIGNTEPMRGRCIETGDTLGGRLLAGRLCRLVMELAFLQERRYWPYDKWFGGAFGRLASAAALSPLLETALTRDEPDVTDSLRAAVTWLGHRHNTLRIGRAVIPSYAPFDVGINHAVRPYETVNASAYIRALHESIKDDRLRHLIQVGSIDQLTHCDDAIVTHTDWPARLTRQYRDAIGSKAHP
jgi:hypothetical protein